MRARIRQSITTFMPKKIIMIRNCITPTKVSAIGPSKAPFPIPKTSWFHIPKLTGTPPWKLPRVPTRPIPQMYQIPFTPIARPFPSHLSKTTPTHSASKHWTFPLKTAPRPLPRKANLFHNSETTFCTMNKIRYTSLRTCTFRIYTIPGHSSMNGPHLTKVFPRITFLSSCPLTISMFPR